MTSWLTDSRGFIGIGALASLLALGSMIPIATQDRLPTEAVGDTWLCYNEDGPSGAEHRDHDGEGTATWVTSLDFPHEEWGFKECLYYDPPEPWLPEGSHSPAINEELDAAADLLVALERETSFGATPLPHGVARSFKVNLDRSALQLREVYDGVPLVVGTWQLTAEEMAQVLEFLPMPER